MFGGKGSGPVLLKVIIIVSHADTRATITSVRTKLSSLDCAMREQDSNIEASTIMFWDWSASSVQEDSKLKIFW
jgi:hypothetical protein